MANISDYLSKLYVQKEVLRENLNSKGIETSVDETLETLVPKVLDINVNEKGINKRLYSFGVVSDIHVKDTSSGIVDETDSVNKFTKALNYYEDNDIDLVCIPGDILAHNRTYRNWNDPPHPSEYIEEGERIWINEVNLFKNLRDSYQGTIYASAGNHDVWANGHFEQIPYGVGYTPIGLNQVITTEHPDYAAYKGKTCLQIWEENVNELQFSFEKNGDVFVFFSMFYWNYQTFCRPEDITWLSQKLEENKDKRVFLFSHVPITEQFSKPSSLVTGLTTSMTAGGFRSLMKQYPNVLWFSGHTHYSLDYEGVYENPNVYFAEGEAIQIHCPSLAYIRREGSPYVNMPNESEGYVIDVYSDKIIIKGIDFMKGTNGLPIQVASYLIS